MSQIPWNDDYNLGIKEIDEQHKKLVAIMNNLNDLIDKGEDDYKTHYKVIFAELMDYTVYHLSFEESEYIDKFGYPSAEIHKSQHKTFVGGVKNRLAQENVESITNGRQLLDFLSSWLLNHIVKADKAWAKHVIDSK